MGTAPFMNAPREWPYAAHPTSSLSEAPMRRTCSSRTESKGMKTGPVAIFLSPGHFFAPPLCSDTRDLTRVFLRLFFVHLNIEPS